MDPATDPTVYYKRELSNLAAIQNCTLLSQFTDIITEINIKCNQCNTEFHEYYDDLATAKHWCSNCKNDYKLHVSNVFNSMNIKITATNLKNIFDYAILVQGKSFLVLVVENELSDYEDKIADTKARIIVIPKTLVLEHNDNLRLYLEDAINSTEKVITYNRDVLNTKLMHQKSAQQYNTASIPTEPQFVNPIDREVEDETKNYKLVSQILENCNLTRDMLIPIDEFSFNLKPIPTPQGNYKICVGYVRVSLQVQALEGSSIKSQISSIKDYINYKNKIKKEEEPLMHLRTIYMDFGLSGKRADNRPALVKLREKLKENQVVIVTSISRICRNLKNALEINDELKIKKCSFVILDLNVDTNDLNGQLIFNVMNSFSEFEAKQTAHRISTVLKHIRDKQNRPISKPFYGWRFVAKGQPFEEVPEEQEMVRYIKRLREKQPAWSYTQYCRHLDALPNPCRRKSKRWFETTLRRIFLHYQIPEPLNRTNEAVNVEDSNDEEEPQDEE